VPLFRTRNLFKEVRWDTLALELLILVIGVTVGLQVNEWEKRRDDSLLKAEYIERLREDFSATVQALQQEADMLKSSITSVSTGANVLHKQTLTKEDHQKLFEAVGASALVGRFGVSFGTVEELKDTGNMRLLRSKDLRIALAALQQSHQQIVRVSQMRNLLRSQSFPVLARQLKPSEEQGLAWDEEMTERQKRDIYIALTVLLQNQKYDLTDTRELIKQVAQINNIIDDESL
jgi:hypothetical protein